MMKKQFQSFLMLLVALLVTFGVRAQAPEYAFPQLLAEQQQVTPGSTLHLAVAFSIQPGWHVYWKNPGDTGLPVQVSWQLPQGWQMPSDFLWPVPKRIVLEPLVSYGFEEELFLLTSVQVPQTAAPGTHTLTAKLDWLVCEEICLPESATVETSVKVGAQQISGSHQQRFDHARAQLPPVFEPALEIMQNPQHFMLRWEDKDQYGNIRFIPGEEDWIDDLAPQKVVKQQNGYLLRVPRDTFNNISPPQLHGLLVLDEQAFEVTADVLAVTEAESAPLVEGDTRVSNIWTALFFAFIAGIVLNLMPCVLPVLALKVMSLVKYSKTAQPWRHGLAYGAGVILSFMAVAGLLAGLRLAGNEVGWGFHLQEPWVVAALMALLVGVGLQMLGVIHVGNMLAALVPQKPQQDKRNGLAGSFAHGVLMMLLAAPCTVPFMGGAVAYAIIQPIPVLLGVFAAMGLGLALPFMLLTFSATARRLMPKPGGWMVTLQKILAVPVLITAVWLGWVLYNQLNPHMPDEARQWSPSAVEQALADDKTVLVNFTADWCVTCKFNEYRVLNAYLNEGALSRHNAVYLVADWTNRNASITQALESYGRSGVPLYVVRKPDGSVQILPQLLSRELLNEVLSR